MPLSKRLAQVGWECVACGTCMKACPKDAIRVVSGVAAQVDKERCVGCGRCAKLCPADVIAIVEREAGV
ncbi:MAG: 4Fe-4S binding protein [Oscillibacter sp.]|nr:4Fe-4S binding protein [Oscillibacter sp.]